MRYWTKVILEDSVYCEMCGRSMNLGDIAFVFKDGLAEDERARCPICMHRIFPGVVEITKA